MALNHTDKKEIEVMIRREIKDFLNSNTLQQFERRIVDNIKKEIKNGSIQGDINEIVTKVMKEFYKIMWTKRSFWEPSLKNVK
jgi:anti-sigma28 factor (negative regulator of flagellin synthesis)|tara:strand:+ start:1263 stop:1511 length:249 start_codon:yes stop_codon:yes gene_type:complete